MECSHTHAFGQFEALLRQRRGGMADQSASRLADLLPTIPAALPAIKPTRPARHRDASDPLRLGAFARRSAAARVA